MAKCELSTDKYISVVKNLIKLNPSEYRNFDKTAEFILKSGLSNYEKSLSLYSIAEIYIGLHGLDKRFYELGKADRIADARVLLDDTDQFISSVSELYSVKKAPTAKIETIERMINDLSKKTVVTRKDLTSSNGILNAIKNYFNTIEFEDETIREGYIDNVNHQLKSMLRELNTSDSHKDLLLKAVDTTISALKKTSQFISLRDIASLAELNNELVTLVNGQMIEAIPRPDGLYVYDQMGNEQKINEKDIVARKDARNDDYSNSNTGKQEFFEDTILSNFKIKPLENEVFKKEQIITKLKKMGDAVTAGIKIHAVKISTVGDDRLKRIHDVAVDPKYKGLANRTYETFENDTQVEYLKSTSKGTVITVARPKQSENQYVLVGEIIGSGEKFYLYPLDNYVFLNSDNTTQKIDFSNPVHLEMVKEHSIKRTAEGVTDLTQNDLETLKNTYSLHNMFKANMTDFLSTKFNDAISSVDVSEQFFFQYSINSQKVGKTTIQNLADLIDTDKSLSRKLTIVTLDTFGKTIKEEERNLIFMFTKFNDYKDASGNYKPKDQQNKFQLVNLLNGNERIKITNAEGEEVDTVTQQAYLDNHFDSSIKMNDTYIKEKIFNGKYYENQNHIIIRFNNNKTYGYKIVKPIYALEQTQGFATFLNTLSDVLQAPDKSSQLRSFNSRVYKFAGFTASSGKVELYANFANDAKGNLQVEIRPPSNAKADSKYGFILQSQPNKGAFNFSLAENEKDLIKDNARTKDLISKVVGENIIFSNLDLNKLKDVTRFYSLLNKLSKDSNPSENVLNLIEAIETQQNNFSKILNEKVIEKLLKVGEFFPGFLDNFNKDYPNPKHLILDIKANGKEVPRVIFADKNESQAKKDFIASASSLELHDIPQKKLVITSKSPVSTVTKIANVPLTEVTEHPIENIPVSKPTLFEQMFGNEVTEETTTKEEIDLSDDIPEIDLFSISNSEVQTETEAQRENSIQWLQNSLPQFDISQEELSTVVDLSKIDGNVLGMFKDRVIHLNNEILSKGVVYHESFHGVFRYLMTPEQRSKLIEQVTSNVKNKKLFTPSALKAFASERNYIYDYEKMMNLQAEEILADGFQNYMIKNTKPKGLLEQLFSLLKKLIDMFIKRGDVIDGTYKDIKRGYYSTAQIQSGMYDGQAAYALIPGLKTIVKNNKNASGVSQKQSSLQKADQNQLVYMVSKYIIEDTSGKTFDEKFETSRQLILNNVYNLDRIIEKNPEYTREEVVKAYGDLYSNYRFMLGARALGETINDVNNSGNDKFNKRTLPNKIKQYKDKSLDNDLGQVSLDVLKKLVKEKTRELYSMLDGVGNAISKDVLAKELSGENEFKSQLDEDAEDNEELSDDVNTEEEFGQHNRLDSAPRQIRRFLAIIDYDKKDSKTGMIIPRVIDGESLYGTLLKITSDISVDNIINHIRVIANTYKEDGNVEAAGDLQAVYDKLASYTSMDENGNPATNKQLYNMFKDVLHGTETNYMIMYATLKTGIFEEEGNNISSFTMSDRVMQADIVNRRRNLVSSMITTHAKKRTDPEYIQSVKNLIAISDKIINEKILMGSSKEANTTLETYTFDLYNAFNAVGISLPKSLIRMSLLAIDKIDNNNNALTQVNKNTLEHYDTNKSLILESAYLQKDYFRDIKAIYKNVIDESITSNAFGKMLDDKNDNLNRFFSVTNKFAKYIIKYDATDLPSVFRNAAGKPVYRYTKYTPLHTISQSIRQEGLLDTLKKDPYYNDFLEDFYSDNPLFNDLLKGDNTKKSKVAKLLMDNMNISLFGGIAQFNNKTYKDGKTFGKLDDQSLHIMSILSFLQRSNISSYETVIDEDGNVTTPKTTIQTYARSFDTLEASQTNFLITALYQQYADTKGVTKNKNNHLKIVDDLEAKVKQEFNRIKKEWNRRSENKTNFDSGTSNLLVNKYNGVLDSVDKTKANVEQENLRAYNFNVFPYFFSAPENELFTNNLTQLAKDNTVQFEDLDESTLSELRDGLNTFAQKELTMYIDELKNLGVVKENEETVKAIKKNTTTGEIILEDGMPIITETRQPNIKYLTSNLIADTLKIDFNKPVSLLDVYSKTKENYDIRGEKVQQGNLEGLLADHFFNNWYNSLNVNEIFTGDRALNVKDGIDATKRNKKFLASGSTMKEGFHRVAYLNTIEGYVNNKYPEYGPYYSAVEVLNDFKITDPSIKKYIYENYRVDKNDVYEIFDGQSISSLFHQADMNDSLGRVTPEILNSIIAKHYRELTEEEVREMEKNKIVNNPKKTVTASRNIYHKQSETYIDRNSVSRLIIPEGSTKEQAYSRLHFYYTDIYSSRKQIQEYDKINKETKSNELDTAIADLEKDIQDTYTIIHKFYEPLPHRVKLHNILNSMEYHNIDQLMDTSASKNATKLPVDYFANANLNEYLPLNLSSLNVNNEDKYLQVETSGVHDTARFSVQGKILIAADLQYVEQLANKRHEEEGTIMSSTERKAMNDIGNVLVKYQETLFDIADSNLQSLKHFLRKDKNFELGKIFNLIRENLESQNAPASMLKLFDVDNSGKPVHNANLPGIRSMLEYYFFSLYSKHVTDERGSGFKNIHVSSFGYNVLENEDGTIVTTEEYQNNPSAYPNVKDRPLTVSIENIYNDAGEIINKRYLVECILPKQFFKNKQQEQFFLDNLTEMFALRIPTEDKRSMIALKVVDYVDSSNLNTIIVPQFIHLLAGSDFDIDSLYGQTYAHYVNVIGNYNKFGEYDTYASANQGKFIEFLQYKMEDEDYKSLVKAKRTAIINSKAFDPSANTLEVMYGFGFNQADYLYCVSQNYFQNINSDDDVLSEEIDQLKKDKEVSRLAFVQAKEDNDNNPSDYTAENNRRIFGKQHADIKVNLQEKFWLQKFVKGALRIEAALQVFEKYGLPVDQKNFDKNIVNHLSVLPIHQNKNLQAKIDILSNEAVFKNLYIHERSSVEAFENISTEYGIDLNNFGTKSDPNTITSLVKSKSLGSSYKDGIGITASLQKFLALASQYGLELNNENIIWKYKSNKTDSLGNQKTVDNLFSKFGSINVDGERVIAINGNILGMFADGMKKPIPAALQMNEVNAGITLAMIGVGLDPAFAFGFNFIPEIKQAVNNIQASRFAISESTSSEYKFLNNEITNTMKSFVEDNGGRMLLKELVDANLITPESNVFKVVINKENLLIDFKAKKLDEYRLENNLLTVNDIGYEVTSLVGDVETSLSSEAQKLILLQLYKEQSQQAWSLRNAGSIVDLYKKLNPSLVSFDKLMKNINELRDGNSIFTVESTDKLFRDKQVWVPLKSAIDDLNEQSVIFLERTSFFRPIANTFGTVFTDPSNIAKTITSFIGIRKYQMNQHKNHEGTDPVAQANFDLDNALLKEVFTADYWFNNKLEEKLDVMKIKYPDNKFLQFLKPSNNTANALNENGKPIVEKTLEMVNKAKISGSLADDVADDANKLYMDENLFMKELFYHELARTALQYKSGSFLQYLPSELQIPISENITEFITEIENTKGDKKELINVIRDYISTDDIKTNEDVYNLFDELFVLMAYGASKEVGNKKIKQVSKISFSQKEGFESGLMKKLNFGTSKLDERIAIAKEAVGNILGINIISKGNSFTLSDKLGTEPLEEFVINMKGADAMPEMSKEAVIEIGNKLNVFKDKDDKNKYKFPLLLKISNTTYLLQGIDDEIDNKNFGKSIINSIAGVGEYKTVGNAAKYMALPKELTNGTLNPIGFSTAESKRYINLINRKIKLPVVEEFDLGEAMSEGLTADMFEDYSIKPETKTSGILTLEKVLKEYTIEQLKQGVSLKSLQEKIEQKDLDTIQKAYNYLKAEEKFNTIKSNNEKINRELESLRQKLTETNETTVGSILTIYNDDNDSQYKIKVLEIDRYADYAIVKGRTTKNKEYTIRIDKYGDTKTGSVDNFIFEAVNPDQKEDIKNRINNLKASLETLKSDPADYYIDYFETSALSKLDLDIQNINVTFDMVKHFYDQSSKTKSFDSYATEFATYAANLKTTGMTNNEIIEKLKCL
jgi:hypothetical protein